ncbi:MAG: tetratricopeptide repeat protein [Myxococcales bacterium]
MGACLVSGCATARSEAETRAQLQAMFKRQAELERRLESLEGRIDAMLALSGPKAPVAGEGAPTPERRPESVYVPSHLATVKVEPEPVDDEELLSAIIAQKARQSPEQQFQAVAKAIALGDTARGSEAALALCDRYPTHPRAAEILHASGLALKQAGELQMAIWTFQRVANHYPLAKQAPEAMLSAAQCELALERTADAHALLTQVIKRYPTSSAARQARGELNQFADDDGVSAVQ